MAESTRGIQMTLFDYFQDTEYFSIEDAKELVVEHQNRDVNRESIRARIYEGIDKGLFERVGKGLYTVTRKDEEGKENTCLLINGDGRDLSVLADNSVDLILTDHPYQLTTSLKGRNRNFADYDLFQYTQKDMSEKSRVLKPGCFCVEFLPEENGDNYRYLYEIKEMARKAGLEYYAKVPWSKQNFVANTGRKSKNTEDICFFTKGRARTMRPDAQKNKAEPGVKHYMSGAAGMLPVSFDFAPPSRKDKLHQAEKPIDLIKEILRYVSLEGETVLDQFAGSGVVGAASLETGRNSILIEKDPETFEKIAGRLQALGEIQAVTPAAQELVSLGKDAIIAQDAFCRTGSPAILKDFMDTHTIDPSAIYKNEPVLREAARYEPVPCAAISKAIEAIEELYEQNLALAQPEEAQGREEATPKILECSARGDRRFCALFATVTIKGKEQSIEEWFQNAKRTADGKKAGKGKPFDHIVCPFTGDKLPAKDAADLYRGLWITYLNNHPDLVEYASGFDDFTDAFRAQRQELTFEEDMAGLRPDTTLSPADIVGAFAKGDKEFYVASVKSGHWYRNMAAKRKPSLSSQIESAAGRAADTLSRKMPPKDVSLRH